MNDLDMENLRRAVSLCERSIKDLESADNQVRMEAILDFANLLTMARFVLPEYGTEDDSQPSDTPA